MSDVNTEKIAALKEAAELLTRVEGPHFQWRKYADGERMWQLAEKYPEEFSRLLRDEIDAAGHFPNYEEAVRRRPSLDIGPVAYCQDAFENPTVSRVRLLERVRELEAAQTPEPEVITARLTKRDLDVLDAIREHLRKFDWLYAGVKFRTPESPYSYQKTHAIPSARELSHLLSYELDNHPGVLFLDMFLDAQERDDDEAVIGHIRQGFWYTERENRSGRCLCTIPEALNRIQDIQRSPRLASETGNVVALKFGSPVRSYISAVILPPKKSEAEMALEAIALHGDLVITGSVAPAGLNEPDETDEDLPEQLLRELREALLAGKLTTSDPTVMETLLLIRDMEDLDDDSTDTNDGRVT